MRPLLLAAALAVAGCDSAIFDPSLVCTAEFVTINVEVVDDFGRSIDGLTYRSVHERTGETLNIDEDSVGDLTGLYPVATDAHTSLLRVDGDDVLFSATGNGLVARARFVLADDGCHVRKEDGPDRIVAEPM
ncbi:MAG: hypothetical protein AAFQ43_13385 [Bacteroidota bacterium]